MRKLLVWIVTIICPGITFLMTGRIFNMIVAFFLQATVIGWLPAIIWARSAWLEDLEAEEKKSKKKIAKEIAKEKAKAHKKAQELVQEQAQQETEQKLPEKNPGAKA